MQQKDYILREIEKIGDLIMGLLGKLKKSIGSPEVSIGEKIEDAQEVLHNEIGFDLALFISLAEAEVGHYLSEFQGMNTKNRELLADLLKETGEQYAGEAGTIYLEKALIMLELCKLEDRTYSLDREHKIEEIKQLLQSFEE